MRLFRTLWKRIENIESSWSYLFQTAAQHPLAVGFLRYRSKGGYTDFGEIGQQIRCSAFDALRIRVPAYGMYAAGEHTHERRTRMLSSDGR